MFDKWIKALSEKKRLRDKDIILSDAPGGFLSCINEALSWFSTSYDPMFFFKYLFITFLSNSWLKLTYWQIHLPPSFEIFKENLNWLIEHNLLYVKPTVAFNTLYSFIKICHHFNDCIIRWRLVYCSQVFWNLWEHTMSSPWQLVPSFCCVNFPGEETGVCALIFTVL